MYWAPWGPLSCGWAMAVVISGMVFSSILPALRQDALDIGRHDLGGGAVDMFVEQRLAAGWLEIELDGMGARLAAPHVQHEARRRIDLARGADRQEQAAALQGGVDLVHVHGHLAEPHDVRPQLSQRLAVGANRSL